MSADYEAKVAVSAAADDVVRIMTTTDYLEAEAVMDGAVKATARIEKSEGSKLVMVVEREDPTREPGAKKGQTEKVTVTTEWDTAARRSSWKSKVHGREKLVSITGISMIEPTGDSSCNIREKGSVDIKLPLVGKLIAGGLASDLKKNVAKKPGLIEKKLKG